MYCSNCGKENNNTNKFCTNCGNLLIKQTNNIKNGNNADLSLILGIVCLVSSFFLNILCFIPGIISIVYAFKNKRENGKLGTGFGLSLSGMIFSFIIFIIYILLFLFIIASTTDGYDGNSYENDVQYTYNLTDIKLM